jgi:hypothetical protein
VQRKASGVDRRLAGMRRLRDKSYGSASAELRKRQEGPTRLNFLVSATLALLIGAAPACAAVEQCRFIEAKPEREACYQRQAMALAAKRNPEPSPDTATLESLQQMRRDDNAVYQSLRSICWGC